MAHRPCFKRRPLRRKIKPRESDTSRRSCLSRGHQRCTDRRRPTSRRRRHRGGAGRAGAAGEQPRLGGNRAGGQRLWWQADGRYHQSRASPRFASCAEGDNTGISGTRRSRASASSRKTGACWRLQYGLWRNTSERSASTSTTLRTTTALWTRLWSTLCWEDSSWTPAFTSLAIVSRRRSSFGGDRPDLQMAALETSTVCLVLTEGRSPVQYIVHHAGLYQVPMLLVGQPTLETMDALHSIGERADVHSTHKARRFGELLSTHCDLVPLTDMAVA